ncbi:MAG: hypothetical protein HY556_04510 [Euryarchaeota archaeon]|nr:hypothetical protein [Euryarchaeota archaeon]
METQAITARVHLVVSLTFFLAGLLWLVWTGPTLAGLIGSVPLIAMGAFSILIFGTSRLLLAGAGGRRVAGSGFVPFVPLILVSIGSGAAFLSGNGDDRLAGDGVMLWSAGMMVHVGLMGATVRRPRIVGTASQLAQGAGMRLLHGAALAYGAATIIAIPLAFRGAIALPSAYHLLLAGFVTNTLMSVALSLLPRFTSVHPPPRVVGLIAVPAAVGPVLLALGIVGDPTIFMVGAILEASALILFAWTVFALLVRSTARRPSFVAYGWGALAITAGAALGLLFAIDPPLRAFAPAHAFTNLLGFVGFFMLGASMDMYAPAISIRAARLRGQWVATMVLAIVGLSGSVAGVLLSLDMVARGGLVLYSMALLIHALGAVATLRRTVALRPMAA